MTELHRIARAVVGDSKPLEDARAFLDYFDGAIRRGIPERALLFVLHDRDKKLQARQFVGRYLTGGGLYVMSGSLGSGKTVAAVRWALVRNATWVQANKAWEASLQDDLRTVPSLVIDELGGPGSVGELQSQRIAALLIDRHALRRATLCTSNLGRDALARLLDGDAERSRVFDRVLEEGAYEEITDRLREHGAAVPWEKVEAANRLVAAWRKVDVIARGEFYGEEKDALAQIAKLRALIKFDDEALAAALEQQVKLAAAIEAAVSRYAGDGAP